uniref:Glycosylphosphatidylinositol anchored high density lipoprotein binding protein 1 n=1 Tax=Ailuropoda melanoleuca TaxID=9646 RepID=A0A7N5P423_AILME
MGNFRVRGRQAPVASVVGGLSGVAPAQSQVRQPQCSCQPAGPGPSGAGGQDAPRNDFLAPPAPEVGEGNGHPWPDAWCCSRCEAHCLRLELGGPGPRGLQEAPEMPSVPLPTDPEPEQEPERADPAAPSRMKAFVALLLALLLCGQPGTGRAQHEEEDDVDFGLDGYDDDDEEEEEEASVTAGGRGRALLQCYSCQSLYRGEHCKQVQNCVRSHSFCKAVISHGNTGKRAPGWPGWEEPHLPRRKARTPVRGLLPAPAVQCDEAFLHHPSFLPESGPLTMYSAWCADACQPFTKTLEGTLMTLTCCQSTLCNAPPWQDPPGSGAAGAQGGPAVMAVALLLSLLPGLQATGS